MWRSGLFSRTLNLPGAIPGTGLIVSQLVVARSLQPVLEILSYSPFIFGVWLLWAGIVCLRARPAPSAAPFREPEAEAAS